MRSLALTTALLVLVLVAAVARATRCPNDCPEILAPVCGSDGVTYSNDCELLVAACKNSSIRKINNGPCSEKAKCNDVCITLYDPVCGSDGETYSNSCFLGIKACENPHLNLKIVNCPVDSS